MHIANLQKVPKSKVEMADAAGAYKQIPISKNDGAPNFSFRVFTIEPGGHTPFHSHPFEHVNYIIEGSGALFFNGKEHSIKKGDFVLVLPGEEHQYRNISGSETFIMICAVPKGYE